LKQGKQYIPVPVRVKLMM